MNTSRPTEPIPQSEELQPQQKKASHAQTHLASSPTAIVYYRLPHASVFTQLAQYNTLRTFQSITDLPISGGYVIVPFQVTKDCPIVLIEPKEVHTFSVHEPLYQHEAPMGNDDEKQREAYHRSFAAAKARLQNHELEKMVLSRRLHVKLPSPAHETASASDLLRKRGENLFLRACQMRPECFIAFWWTEQTGAWLVATPEPILQKQNKSWHTVALAGTLPFQAEKVPYWSKKNIEEQAIVARYIKESLHELASDLIISDTHTVRTGNLLHLCTDYTFSLPNDKAVLTLLSRLHPTPAVCGMPHRAALHAIEEDENTPRRYYAGFSGPLHLQGDTQLFVSLRCMEYALHDATLYAGGGLMPASEEKEEWEETHRKLLTMLELLGQHSS